MNLVRDDTIYALSSGLLPSGVAIIRISGPQCRFVIETIIQKDIKPRLTELVLLKDPSDNTILDQALVLWFPSPNSFTGEDVLEFHCHGGRAVVAAILKVLSKLRGLRMAEAGEFTRRAFLNNKMDFVEVEGLSDLISAETEMQRKLAQLQSNGLISSIYEDWRKILIESRAMIEAELDFPDEEDIPGSVSDLVWPKISELKDNVKKAIRGTKIAERIRDGISVVLVGAPNAGKSSLLNLLSGRDVAIVSNIAGTTRDSLDVYLDLDGVAVTLTDTAGLRDSSDEIELIGIQRAQEKIENCDLIVYLEDSQSSLENSQLPDEFLDLKNNLDKELLFVGTKIDLFGDDEIQSIRPRYDILISSKTECSIEILIQEISEKCKLLIKDSESLIAVRERHKEALESLILYLDNSLDNNKVIELRAEDLRLAADVLARITGRIDVEDLLDVVFGEFCIGK